MTQNREKLAELVQQLLVKKAEERRKAILEERGDVHEAEISIDRSTFRILSEAKTESGDTIIKWKATEYVLTEFTVSEPYRFERAGELLLKHDGSAELL